MSEPTPPVLTSAQVVLQALIDSQQFNPEQVKTLEAIKARSPARVNYKDSCEVHVMVHNKMREP